MNVFILHGSYGKPFENWFPWMENKLAEEEILCTIPTFPTPNNQEYSSWKELLDYYVKKGIINEETVLIGHSCGAVCAAKFLAETNIKIKALISVAGYNNFYSGDHMDDLNGSFYFPSNFCSDIDKTVPTRYAYFSDNDPFIPFVKLEEFAFEIKATPKLIKNAGHFNASAGYCCFEELLNTISAI
ncbi:MAG: alpha/beta hydrolase [Clostridia bacterium]|nr:alpha/beta hydrolase [Clostridia bacterium]